MKRWFQPTISIDGVAVIVAIVLGAVAYGKLSSTVDRHEKDIGELKTLTAGHEKSITELQAIEKFLIKKP